MRWIPFIILLYVAAVLQTAVVPFFAVHGIRPDLLVVLAAHYALTAKAPDALLACWLVGLAADLTGLGFAGHSSVGLHAVAMGFAALLVVGVRDWTFRDSPVTQLLFTFLMALFQAVLVGTYLCYAATNRPAWADVLLSGIYSAAYTTILAPYGHWVLRRMRHALGLGAFGRIRVG